MGAVLTPDSGAPVSPTDPIVFDVTDADEALTGLLITLRHDTGIVELVHDGSAFTAFYSAGSTRTVITNGYRFSLVRVGGWADVNVSISAYPFAGSGVGLINFSSDFEVLSDPPGEDVALSVTGVAAGTYGDATHVGRFTVDTKGRLSAASSVTISIPVSAISDSTAAGRGLVTAANAAAQRTTLGLVIGTDVQAQDAELAAIAALASAANKLPYFTGSGTATLADLTAAGRALIDDADAAAQRTTLGLVIGTDVQAQDAELAAIAGLVSAADRLPYFTGSGSASLATFTAAGRALVDDADATAQRTTLGLVIGTDVQAHDADLDALAGLATAANKLPYFTGAGAAALADFTAAGRALVDDADTAAQRTTLGLVIGTDVQAHDAELDALAGLTSAADKLPYFTGSGTAALATFTTAGRALVDDADTAAQRTTLGLVIGTDVQAHDAELDALAGLVSAADRVPYFTGSGSAALSVFTGFGRTLVAQADAAAVRLALALGSMATQDASAVAIIGGTITGMPSPSSSSDVATKAYVDSLAGGGASWKAPARVAIDSNVTIASALVNGATGDGVTLATGDRVLLFGQTTTSQNGIYVVAASGAASRATDADAGSELLGASLFVTEGTSYHDKAFICTTDAPITLGSTALTFVQFGSFTGGLLAANNLSDLTSVSSARTNLGLAIGTDVQAQDAELTAIAGLTSASNKLPYFTGSGTAALADLTAAGRALIDDADAAAQRTTLGLVIGTDVQAQDAELTAIAGLTSAADRLPYFTGLGTAALATFTTAGRALIDDADAAAQRTTLGLVIGTDVQAQDAELAAIAGLVSAADRLPYFTGSGAASLATFTAAGRALIDDADTAAQRTTLGLVIGTDVQAQDAELAAIAGLVSAADRLPYFTGSGSASLATFTAAGRSLVAGADASAQRTTLGLGTMATQAASSVAITGGTITGITDLAIADGGTNASTAIAAADNLSTKSSNIASATTTDLSTATGSLVHITGTTTITGFGTVAAGAERVLVFDGVLTLTHNATSLILPGAANIVTAAGDMAIVRSEGSGNWRCVNFVRGAVAPTNTGAASWGGSTVTQNNIGIVDDWAPTGYADAFLFVVTGTTAYIRGIQGGVDGRVIVIKAASSALAIEAEAATSTAANRFQEYTPGSGDAYLPTLNPGQTAVFRYSAAVSRWVSLSLPPLLPQGVNGDIQFNYFAASFQPGTNFYGAYSPNIMTDASFSCISFGSIKVTARMNEHKGTDTASATEMTLPGWVGSFSSATDNAGGGNAFKITGTTTIKGIDTTGWQAGSRIRLTFDSTITIQDGFTPTAPKKTIYTKSGNNLEMQAGEWLTLLYDGTSWNEV